MPGGIWTNLQRHWDPEVLASTKAMVTASGISAKTPEQGAATSVLLATSPALTGIGGRYFEDCQEAEVVPESVNGSVRCPHLCPRPGRRHPALGCLPRTTQRSTPTVTSMVGLGQRRRKALC